jgi:hypothetical protein
VPSNTCLENTLESNLTYRTYVGKLSLINTYYADVNLNIQKFMNKKSTKKHIVGLGLYNDKEGNFFNKTRILGRYSFHIPLKDSIYLSVGVALHVINYNFHSTGSGALGADYSWSGNSSTTLYGSSWNISASYNDFNNPVLRPINYEFRLPHYLTIFGEKTFDVNYNTQWKSSGKINFTNKSKSSYVLQTGVVLSSMVGLNSFYYAHKGWGFAVDINKIKLYKSKLDFSVAYFIPKRLGNPPVNQFEFNLKFTLPENSY